MSAVGDRAAAYERLDRSAKLARTYVRKAVDLLQAHGDMVGHVPTSYWALLDEALDRAADLVDLLPDDYFEETEGGRIFGIDVGKHNLSDAPLERAEKVSARIAQRRAGVARRRLAELLENTAGRTPEEAAAFLTKAAELRGDR